jgi:serine/threonine-protein kinase
MSTSDENPGRIGRFVIERRLAHQPGVSSVYAAHDRRHGGPVALRVLALADGRPAAAWRAHGRAMACWRQLVHPGLVPLVAAGRGREGLWVATHRVAGSSLAELLRDSGPLAPDRAIAMLAPVADALDLVHTHELVCDALTADTVLVCGPRGEERALLTDIGPPWPSTSRPGRLLGQLDGLPPEEIRGAAPTIASNVYALAAILVRCLTGAPPFPASSRASALVAHLQTPAPRVSARRPALPVALDEVLDAALAKEPSRRPASAGELIRSAAISLGQEATVPARMRQAPVGVAPAPRPTHTVPAAPPTGGPDAVARDEPREPRAPREGWPRVGARIVRLAPVVVLIALAAYAGASQLGGAGPAPSRVGGLPPAPPRGGRPVASAMLRPPGSAADAHGPTGAVRIDVRGKRLVLTIAGENLPAEGRDPVQAYTVWLINARDDALRLGAINPPVAERGSFLSHGTLPAGSQRYRRIVVTLESRLGERPMGPIVLTAALRIPSR